MALAKGGSARALLSNLKLAQLRDIAISTGVNSSGTKPSLIASLQHELAKDNLSGLPEARTNGVQHTYSKKTVSKQATNYLGSGEYEYYHVLSIDMGIRNLAYCRMLVPRKTMSTSRMIPIIKEWLRVAVSGQPSPSMSQASYDAAPLRTPKEAFDPLTYSRLARSLIDSLLTSTSSSSFGPVTHVLIERQRYRSMSSSSVQEWTLRVNMFEAMLYAVLCTLSEQGLWEGSIWPVQPSKVWGYWTEILGRTDTLKADTKGSKAQKTKKAKIDTVGRWLQASDDTDSSSSVAYTKQDQQVAFEDASMETRQRYLEKWKGKRGSNEIGKLDDLADCLLQGVAWIRWEETKRRLLGKGGIEKFLRESM